MKIRALGRKFELIGVSPCHIADYQCPSHRLYKKCPSNHHRFLVKRTKLEFSDTWGINSPEVFEGKYWNLSLAITGGEPHGVRYPRICGKFISKVVLASHAMGAIEVIERENER